MARVAIDEPSAELRLLFARTVARLGHQPVAAAEALGADAVLLDPDGRDFPAAPPPGVPVILCSVYPPGPAFARFRAVAHLVKPFSREELEGALALALAGGVVNAA